MIDLHVHILPGIDDGAPDIKEALAMAKAAVSDGITGLVATPHVIKGTYNNNKQIILSAVSDFNNQLIKKNINLKVYPGAEYMLDADLPRLVEEGRAMTINNSGRYLLVEFPLHIMKTNYSQILYELLLNGVTPIIAHPERNPSLIQDPDLLGSFLEIGALSQLTSGSLLGFFGSRAKKLSWHYLRHGMCQVISTDSHTSYKGEFSLSQTSEIVEADLGKEIIELLTCENPGRIIDGKETLPMPIIYSRRKNTKRSFFSKLFRRV